MFVEGTIIYFTPFHFKNGNKAKNKYFVILKNLPGGEMLIASLPTSHDHIPEGLETAHGCVNCDERRFNCFVFSDKAEVTQCGKRFPRTTFIYGEQIDDYKTAWISEKHPKEGQDYLIWGQMKPDLFASLIACFSQSKTVKNKYRRAFTQCTHGRHSAELAPAGV